MADRDLSAVIDAMLAVIPETETGLRSQLEWRRRDVLYKAPEQRVMCWRGVLKDLLEYVPVPASPWELEMARIFTGDTAPAPDPEAVGG